MGDTHPPLSLSAADFDVRRPPLVRERFGIVFDYLARVELEVSRNVLEIDALLPQLSDTDTLFYRDVWHPQELQHGVLLDELLNVLNLPAATPDTTEVSSKIRIAGLLAHLPGINDVFRLIYYLTGAATERAAVEAYSRLHRGLIEAGETAIAETIISPIRRQEPGHFTFYRRSAELLVHSGAMRPWQLALARSIRRQTFGLVGANNRSQVEQFGAVAISLGMDESIDKSAAHISRVERDLLWSQAAGRQVPSYVTRALRDAVDAAREHETPATPRSTHYPPTESAIREHGATPPWDVRSTDVVSSGRSDLLSAVGNATQLPRNSSSRGGDGG